MAYKRNQAVTDPYTQPDGRFVTEAHISHLVVVCQMLAERYPDEYAEVIKRINSLALGHSNVRFSADGWNRGTAS